MPPPANQVVKARGLWSGPVCRPLVQPAVGQIRRNKSQVWNPTGRAIKSRHQRRHRFIGFAGKLAMIADDVNMAIPTAFVFVAAGIELHETNTTFHQSAGE